MKDALLLNYSLNRISSLSCPHTDNRFEQYQEMSVSLQEVFSSVYFLSTFSNLDLNRVSNLLIKIDILRHSIPRFPAPNPLQSGNLTKGSPPPLFFERGWGQGNVKVSAKVLIFRVCGDLKIRNTNIA